MGKTDFLFLLFAAQAVANEQQVNTKDEGQRTRSETDLAKEDDAEFWDRFLDTFDIDTFSNSVNPSKKKFSFSLSLSEPPTQAPSPAPPGSLAPSVHLQAPRQLWHPVRHRVLCQASHRVRHSEFSTSRISSYSTLRRTDSISKPISK